MRFFVTDGVFSMDGDLAPLHDLANVAKRFDAWLLADDAHGLGVVGGGRGSSFADGNGGPADVPLQMGTLSKAIGAYGGYLCASQAVIDLMYTRARTFIYSTGLPPPVVAAAIAALDIVEHDKAYVAEPLRKARLSTPRALDLPEPQSAIVPLVLGDSDIDDGGGTIVGRRRLSGRRHQAANRAARLRAAAFCLYRPASRRRDRAA